MLNVKGRLGLALLGLLAAAGCGGGGHRSSNNNDASLRMTMAWPAPNRAVPNAANSVVTVVKVKGKEVARALFSRPNSSSEGGSATILLQRLPAGRATVTLTAYPGADGTGVPQAEGTAVETLVKGQIVEDHASMASTVETLAIQPAPIEVAVGATQPLEVSARDAQSRVVLLETNFRESLEWASANAAKAAVAADGDLTGVALGTTEVSVSMVVNDGGAKKTATAPVTVVAAPRTLVSIATNVSGTSAAPFDFAPDPTDPNPIDREQLDVIGTYDDSSTADLSGEATWTSSDPSVVEMDGQNMVRKGPGTAIVTVSVGGLTRTIHVRTSPAITLSSLAIAPTTVSITSGATLQLTATATYSDGSTADVTNDATWTSYATNIATVGADGLLTGVFSGVGSGNTAVEANLNGVTAIRPVSVAAARTLTSVSISSSGMMYPGAPWNLQAFAHYSDNTSELVTSQVTWASSAPQYATVDSAGILTYVSGPGSTTITATLNGVVGSSGINTQGGP